MTPGPGGPAPGPRRARWVGAALVGVLAGGLGLAGCSRGGQQPAADPAVVRGLDLGSTGIRQPSTQRGGTLTLVTGAVDSLDPQRSYSPGVWNVMRCAHAENAVDKQ